MTAIYINDFQTSRRSEFTLSPDNFAHLRSVWDQGDRILRDMQAHAIFAGRLTWADLDMLHWRVLLESNLHKIARLDDTELLEADNPAVQSLQFLICGLVECLQAKADIVVELLHINRTDEDQVAVDFTAILPMNMAFPEPTQKLHVVVDNS